ncbi:maleylpyruvate isomerase family mycothiol-dependent enzyme [Actinopolymorpha pittospori]|uniref:Uncharacterized protein (TIGR03083 family) n=1 Tax=Actinopolymorpha pittospori TaxID=648752 RepID=A0A927N6I3_9ACTN|nr:uncharacterized protein (TIGR03083 family) [Actinopolymorpha pittospori]
MTDLPHGVFDPATYQRLLRAHGDALLDALATGPSTTKVPTCPDWTLRDLVHHVGQIHHWATAIVRTGTGPNHPQLHAEEGEDVGEWYAERLQNLLDALAQTDPDTPTWGFGPCCRTARFWSRRQTHEAGMHRVDAELAIGRSPLVDPILAVDGVSEVFDVMMARVAERTGTTPTLPAPVLLECTDRPERWLLCPDDGSDAPALPKTLGPDLPDDLAATAVAAVRGRAGDLWLALWGRDVAAGCTPMIDGDAEVARALLASRLVP